VTQGTIFDIKRYAIHDGPGIRTTIFFKGCPLTCMWCHNPESHVLKPEILYWEERCIQCGACVEACPEEALTWKDGGLDTDRSRCNGCGTCVSVCPAGARELAGRTVTVDNVMHEVKKDTLFYEESGGGITLSGGEPLAQPEFCLALLQRCRSLGIKTALDTSGYAPEETLLAIAEFVDLFLYDLKSMDEKRHRAYTGVSNTEILRNLKQLDKLGKRIWIRFPLIPGINDDLDHVTRLGEFVATLSSVEAIHVLPYHRGGAAKRSRLGWTDPPSSLTPPTGKMTDAVLARLREIVRIPVRLGG